MALTPSSNMDLTCWYINERRVAELVGHDALAVLMSRYGHRVDDEFLQRLARLASFKDAVVHWMARAKPQSLGRMSLSGELKEGALFTHYGNWFFKNPAEAPAGAASADTALAYAKLDDIAPGLRVECRYDRSHLTSVSARGELAGQKPLLFVGLITSIRGNSVEAIPYVVASPLARSNTDRQTPAAHWGTRLEVFIDQIDSFAKAQRVRVPKNSKALAPLENIPEVEIKNAFAQIIQEPTVNKDWGGERSDLFTTRLVMDGRRIATAFAFKGPAKFKPLAMSGLGKNGDQIDRLFSEPADLLVLQHCHEITPPVRGAMRAYAQQMGNLRLFCLIDGYETLRILKAYGRCGFKYSPRKVK